MNWIIAFAAILFVFWLSRRFSSDSDTIPNKVRAPTVPPWAASDIDGGMLVEFPGPLSISLKGDPNQWSA